MKKFSRVLGITATSLATVSALATGFVPIATTFADDASISDSTTVKLVPGEFKQNFMVVGANKTTSNTVKFAGSATQGITIKNSGNTLKTENYTLQNRSWNVSGKFSGLKDSKGVELPGSTVVYNSKISDGKSVPTSNADVVSGTVNTVTNDVKTSKDTETILSSTDFQGVSYYSFSSEINVPTMKDANPNETYTGTVTYTLTQGSATAE